MLVCNTNVSVNVGNKLNQSFSKLKLIKKDFRSHNYDAGRLNCLMFMHTL